MHNVNLAGIVGGGRKVILPLMLILFSTSAGIIGGNLIVG
jgi:hypothetical protein